MTPPASDDHPYSPARLAPDGAVYLSGIVPYDEDGAVVREFPAAAQQALTTLAARLTEVGCTLDDVVKTTVFVTDIARRAEINRVYAERFREPRPARTMVQVSALPAGSALEIEAVAYRPLSSPRPA